MENDIEKEIFLSNKDDKFKFLSLLFDLICCLIDKNRLFCSPICFDATLRSSGFQHIAGIFKDTRIAAESNVVSDNEEPKDVYATVALNVEEQIKELDDNNLKEKFLKIKFNRNLLKRAVMTVPYNVGGFSRKNYKINLLMMVILKKRLNVVMTKLNFILLIKIFLKIQKIFNFLTKSYVN